MDEDKTVKMDSSTPGSDATVQAGPAGPRTGGQSPYVRQPTPNVGGPSRGERPTPHPGAAPANWGASGAAPQADGATVMIGQQRSAPLLAFVVIVEGSQRGQVFTLQPDTTTIGRSQGNDVVLADDTCSGQHAKIKLETAEAGDAHYVLYDLASRNGTFAGSKTTYRTPESRIYRQALHDGDYLLLGETTLVFKQV